MAQYKLKNALPQSAHGSTEAHYGHACKILNNAVWIELGEVDAKNFLLGGRIDGPIIPDAKEVPVESVKEVKEDKPKNKRGPKPKVAQEELDDVESLLAEGIDNLTTDDSAPMTDAELQAFMEGE